MLAKTATLKLSSEFLVKLGAKGDGDLVYVRSIVHNQFTLGPNKHKANERHVLLRPLWHSHGMARACLRGMVWHGRGTGWPHVHGS